MADTVLLPPHEPLPDRHSVVVLRRFDETNPRATVIEIVVRDADGAERTDIAAHPDGRLMTWEEAGQAAAARAGEEGLPHALLIDRTQGSREREVLDRGGDHSFAGDALDDADPEDGEAGPDMRDRRPG
jgi:hypothetical protein